MEYIALGISLIAVLLLVVYNKSFTEALKTLHKNVGGSFDELEHEVNEVRDSVAKSGAKNREEIDKLSTSTRTMIGDNKETDKLIVKNLVSFINHLGYTVIADDVEWKFEKTKKQPTVKSKSKYATKSKLKTIKKYK